MAALSPKTNDEETRSCPQCGSSNTQFIQRGFAGLTDASDQYVNCHSCGQITYEIISRTGREIRIDRIEPGRTFKYAGNEYTVRRILRVGLDESLVYVQLTKTNAR